MANVRLYSGEKMPLEMHKVRIVQKLNLRPVEYRHEAMSAAGNNTFLLQNDDVFLDMLTDSGVNAMSDRQQAAMLTADDSYAGSATYTRLESRLHEIFGMDYFMRHLVAERQYRSVAPYTTKARARRLVESEWKVKL